MSMTYSDTFLTNIASEIIEEVSDGLRGFYQKDFDRIEHERMCKEMDRLHAQLAEAKEVITKINDRCNSYEDYMHIVWDFKYDTRNFLNKYKQEDK